MSSSVSLAGSSVLGWVTGEGTDFTGGGGSGSALDTTLTLISGGSGDEPGESNALKVCTDPPRVATGVCGVMPGVDKLMEGKLNRGG